ncbi:antifreeze protein [Ochrobactrum sp. CM-21-5]|nr:antifreeze protein [Ochrobactrum sp. CM-21-5]MBC2887533.1 antifreeze protein [Ochrobactrum sp. CM-21-5]
MRKAVLAFAALATVATGVATPTLAADNGLRVQVQYYDDDGYRPPRHRPGWDGPDRRPSWGDGYVRRDVMSPRRIARSLERRGYDVGDMRLERGTYFVRATRPSGRRVMLMVDAFNGRIVGERRAGPRPADF